MIIRTIHNDSLQQIPAINALAKLRSQGEMLCVVPQNLIEFWAVATRPISANGLGLSIEEAESEIAQIKLHFALKTEDKTIFENWQRLVKTYRVSGKTTHDARIVAAMQMHGIMNLLTFNVSDFQRYSQLISVKSPQEIITKP